MSFGYVNRTNDRSGVLQEFNIVDSVLLKYLGNDSIVNIPNSVVSVTSLLLCPKAIAIMENMSIINLSRTKRSI